MLVLSECVVLYVCRAKLCAGVIDPVRVCLFVCMLTHKEGPNILQLQKK